MLFWITQKLTFSPTLTSKLLKLVMPQYIEGVFTLFSKIHDPHHLQKYHILWLPSIRENVIPISGFWIKIRFKLSFVSLSFLAFKEHPIKIIPFCDDKNYGLMIPLLGIFTRLLWGCGLKYTSIHIMLGSTDLHLVLCCRDIIKISKLMVLGYPIIKQDL